MIQGIVITMLAVETISDIRTKTISVLRIGIFFIAAIILNGFFYYQSVFSMLGGIMIGMILLAYAFLTREGIGYGDGLIFICAGAYLGLSDNLHLLFFSLILAAVAGGIYTIIRKKSMKTKIPFIPCILGTYLMMALIEVLP